MSTVSGKTLVKAYSAASAAAVLVPAVVFGALAQFDFADGHPILFAGTLSCVLALGFGLKWPHKAWRWGVWVSSGFGLILLLAFIGLLRAGRTDAGPLMDALAVVLAACAAAAVGGRVGARAAPPASVVRPGD